MITNNQTHQHRKAHLQALLRASNVAKRLATLRGCTPYEHLWKCWHQEPERRTVNPCQHTLGLNSYYYSGN
jgi:hypothetical protein